MTRDRRQAEFYTDLDNRLEQILEDTIAKHHDSQSGETFEECVLCGEWDGHEVLCPIPAIDKWVNTVIK